MIGIRKELTLKETLHSTVNGKVSNDPTVNHPSPQTYHT